MQPCRADKEVLLESKLEQANNKIQKLKCLVKEAFYDGLTDGWDTGDPSLSWERSISKQELDEL